MAKIWLGDEETYGLECCFDGKPGSYGETEVSDAELAELATLSAAVSRPGEGAENVCAGVGGVGVRRGGASVVDSTASVVRWEDAGMVQPL